MKLFLFSALLLLFWQASAQNRFDVQWGKPLESPKKNEQVQAIVATDGEAFVALRQKDTRVPYGFKYFSNPQDKASLELYNKDLRLLKSVPIELEHKNQNLGLEDVLVLGGKLFVLTSFFNSKLEKSYLFARPIETETLNASGEHVKILEIKQLNKLNPASYGFTVSPDTSKLLATARLAVQNGKHEQVVMAVFDSNLKQLWEKTVELPYPENDIEVEHFSVDAGNAYVLAKRYRSRKEKADRKDYDYDYHVFSWRNGGADFREHKAQLSQKHVSGITFRALENGDLLCAGFYSEEGKGSGTKGAFLYKISTADGSQQATSIKEFDFDVRISDLSERKQEKAEKKVKKGDKEDEEELYSYRLRKLIPRSDGSALLVGEQFYVTTHTSSSFNGKTWSHSTYSVEHYNNILVVQILPDGQIGWASMVEKAQAAQGSASSYSFAQQDDLLYFVFSQRKPAALAETDLKIATVALADGKVETDFLTRKLREKTDMDFDAYVSLQINENTLVLHASRGKDYRFGKVTLP